jgi:hypothetical protein
MPLVRALAVMNARSDHERDTNGNYIQRIRTSECRWLRVPANQISKTIPHHINVLIRTTNVVDNRRCRQARELLRPVSGFNASVCAATSWKIDPAASVFTASIEISINIRLRSGEMWMVKCCTGR